MFLAPTLVLLTLFDVLPVLLAGWISLWRWGIRAEEFIGVDNYRRVVQQVGGSEAQAVGEVGQSMLVSTFYALGTVPVTLALAFAIANMLFQKVRFLPAFRTAYFIPYITSTVAAGLAFAWLFNPQIGVLNAMLEAVGLPAQTWLLDPDPVLVAVVEGAGRTWPAAIPEAFAGPSVALACVMAFTVWNTLGFSIVIILAGLVAINPEVLEAARVDGASPYQLARRIILPLLSPTMFFLLVVSTIGAFQSFNEIYVLTSGGGYGAGAGSPLDTTLTLPVLIFRHLYERPGSVGYAAALSMVLFGVLLVLTLIQFRVAGSRVHYE